MSVPGWDKVIEAAQLETSVEIGGETYRRLAYGPDHPDTAVRSHCWDCNAAIGQLHVVDRCTVERCPRCLGQSIGCTCSELTVH